MLLRGLGAGLGRHRDGLLGAAGRRVPGRGEDLGPVAVQRHRGRAERAADLAHGRGAHHPVVAVVVVGGDLAEFVPGGLGGLLVVGGGLVRGGVAGERAEFQQRAGGGRAVEVAVGDDGAVVGAAGAAVGAGAGPGPAARRTAGAGWPRLRRRGGRSRSRPGCRRAGCRLRASRSAPGPGRGPGRGGRSRRSSAGPARARAGRAPRASWWRPRGSSRRTARCPGRGRRRSGVPRRPRGRRSRWCRGAAGREKVSMSVQSTASDVLASLNSSGMDASSRSSQIAVRVCDGRPSGMSLASASATRPKVRSVCR